MFSTKSTFCVSLFFIQNTRRVWKTLIVTFLLLFGWQQLNLRSVRLQYSKEGIWSAFTILEMNYVRVKKRDYKIMYRLFWDQLLTISILEKKTRRMLNKIKPASLRLIKRKYIFFIEDSVINLQDSVWLWITAVNYWEWLKRRHKD